MLANISIENLWEEIFGDELEFIDEYLNEFSNVSNIEIQTNDCGEAVGMGHFPEFDCEIGRVTYLYALGVSVKYRNKGIAAKITNDIFHKTRNQGGVANITIPEPRELQDWYRRKFGFCIISENVPIEFDTRTGFDLGTGNKSDDIGMIRIVNVEKYMECYARKHKESAVTVTIKDDIIEENNITINLENGESKVFSEGVKGENLDIADIYKRFPLPIGVLKG